VLPGVEDWLLMSMHEDEPELAGYEPVGERPLHGRRRRLVTQIVVVLGLLALILPGIFTTISVGGRTAQASCALWVAHQEPDATGSSARFQVFGPGVVGWECYTAGGFGGTRHIASLGLIPGAPVFPAGTSVEA